MIYTTLYRWRVLLWCPSMTSVPSSISVVKPVWRGTGIGVSLWGNVRQLFLFQVAQIQILRRKGSYWFPTSCLVWTDSLGCSQVYCPHLCITALLWCSWKLERKLVGWQEFCCCLVRRSVQFWLRLIIPFLKLHCLGERKAGKFPILCLVGSWNRLLWIFSSGLFAPNPQGSFVPMLWCSRKLGRKLLRRILSLSWSC